MKNKYYLVLILLLVSLIFINSNFGFAQEQDNIKLINGIEYYYNHEYNKAIENFSDFLKNDLVNEEMYIDALYYQTLSYIKNKEVNMAKNNIKKLKNNGYEFARIHWEIGKLYLNKEGYYDSALFSEAKNELEKASMLGVDSPEFHSDLASAYQ